MSPRAQSVQPTPATDLAPRIAVARPLLPAAEHVLPYLERIDEARWYSNFGPLVSELEQRLSAHHGGAALVTTANATQGLALALKAAAPRPGLCLMPGFTFVATAHAAIQAGHAPYFLDVEAETWMLTPAAVEAAIERLDGAVSSVIVVAAFGAMPDVEGLADVQARTGVPIILDAAAAFDSLGAPRLTSVVSLHATKVLGIGEGGYVVGPDAELIQRIHVTSSFGFAGQRRSLWAATNAKISEYAAAVGLAALDGWPGARLRWMLAGRKLQMACLRADLRFQPGFGVDWVSSTCVVRTAEGAGPLLKQRLAGAAIDSRDWWGAGLHREPAFQDCPRDPLPNVERLALATLGLPFTIDLSDDDIRMIAGALI